MARHLGGTPKLGQTTSGNMFFERFSRLPFFFTTHQLAQLQKLLKIQPSEDFSKSENFLNYRHLSLDFSYELQIWTHHFVDQSWVHFILSSAVRRLIQYQLFFFNRTLHERGSKLEIPDFVCVRMLDANFFDHGKISIFFIFGGLDPEYYNTRIDINIVYVHMLGAKHFLFLKISCFDFFVEKHV